MSMGINFSNKTPKHASKIPAFTLKDSLMGYNSSVRSCFDVAFYDIHLNFDMDKKSVGGYVTTAFTLVTASKTIQLDLDEVLVIDSITQDHKQLKYTRKYTAVFIDLISETPNQHLTVYYHGKPKQAKRPPWEGGLVWKRDKNDNPFVSVACEGEGAQTWLPVKTYLGDEPDSVAVHLTVPSHLIGVSNGNLTGVTDLGSKKTYSWKTSYPVNPYNITFYIGDYKLIEKAYSCIDGETMMLRYYVLPENSEKAKTHFLQVDSILHVYENLFGKYPWVKDNYKLVESPFAGMEHQTAIAYGNGYKNEQGERYDYIVLHETAHEWWGNAVSVADFADVWIHEGMATYAEALYIEKTKGYKAYLDYISYTHITVMNKKPVIGPAGVYYWNYKDGDPYVKGSAMMHSLRNHVDNDTLFFKLIRTFFKTYCYKSATTQNFIDMANTITGKDLNVFFQQYLYRRESPLLKWRFDHDERSGRDVLVYHFERVVDGFTTPVEVRQGKTTFYITPTQKEQFVVLPEPLKVFIYINEKCSYLQEK
ncbi:MAG: M1 family metallopeptidase [Bacteroidota bacterium]